MKVKNILKYYFPLFSIIFGGCGCEVLPPEIRQALNGAVAYYNQTMEMLSLTELFKKYVDRASLELSEDSPNVRGITQVLYDLDKLFDRLSIMEDGEPTDPAPEIQEFNELRKFQGVKLEDEVMAKKAEELKLMRESVRVLYEGLEKFKYIQMDFVLGHYDTLYNYGIKLGVEPKPNHIIITDQEKIDTIKEYQGKDSKIPGKEIIQKEQMAVKSVHELNLEFPQDQPRQTNMEILAMERASKGEPLDPITIKILEGFVADINVKIPTFIQQLDKVEVAVADAVKTYSDNLPNYKYIKQMYKGSSNGIKIMLDERMANWENWKSQNRDEL